MRGLRWAAIVALSLRALAAQSEASLSGKVIGIEHSHIPFVEVTLRGDHNDCRRATFADSDGGFSFDHLVPGPYTVILISPDLGIGVAHIEVEGAPGTIGAVSFSSPLPGGGGDGGYAVLDLVRAQPEIAAGQQGSAIEGEGPYGFRANTSFNANGQRGQNNGFALDGMDNNDAWTGGAILNPPAGAVGAVSLLDGFIPAELGHATGASVSAYTRSASKELHGSAHEEFGDSALDARNFFDGASKPASNANQFGANLGGPVRKGNWYYFADVEGLRSRQGLTVISTVPTAAQKTGSFAFAPIYNPFTIAATPSGTFERQLFPNNQIPQSLLSRAGENLLALYPDPNLPGVANNYRYTPSGPTMRAGSMASRLSSSRRTTTYCR